MSLWSKSLAGITYEDVNAFCEGQYPEGLMLDYKREVPGDIAKIVAAFANTRGGLLVLGVAGDPVTNLPVMPIEGMAIRPGISEQIGQCCRANIHPAILPEISPVIRKPGDQDRGFVVVRVDSSIEAPHMLTRKNQVYIRTGDVNDPFGHADVDQLSRLFARRDQARSTRDWLQERQLQRVVRHFPADPGTKTWGWWFMSPELPDEPIVHIDDCRYGAMELAAGRAPDGYWGSSIVGQPNVLGRREIIFAGAGQLGDISFARLFRPDVGAKLPGPYIATMTRRFLFHCQQFLNERCIKRPAMLRFCMRIEGAVNKEMSHFFDYDYDQFRFPDESLRVERLVHLDKISAEEERNQLAFEVMKEVFHGFGMGEPAPMHRWG